MLDPSVSQFETILSASKGEESKLGKVTLEWMEDELYPRMFEVVSSEHPWVFEGDKVYIIAGKNG